MPDETHDLPDPPAPVRPDPPGDTRTHDSAQTPSVAAFAAGLEALAGVGGAGAAEPRTLTQDGPPAAVRDATPPAVPGYAVLREIARGGQGRVYAARDLALGRDVAIKTLLPELAGHPGCVAQFGREARVTARLSHPGVPPVHALGLLPCGRPFLAMKLIRGRTLADELRAADPPGLPRLLEAFEQVCQAVGYAHSRGVVHRDLKPLNVMVGAFGEVQVMDWGLAKILADGDPGGTCGDAPPPADPDLRAPDAEPEAATRPGSVKGTPAYMPPEQANGDWSAVGPRADVFALGAILCQILTGHPPYTGPDVRGVLRRAAAGDTAEAFGRLDRCGADPELVALCTACLSPAPRDRPADGGAVAGLLGAYRAEVEARARRAEAERAAAEARAEGATRRAEAEERARLAAEERVAAEAARAGEQRRRRRAQTALAGAVVLLALGVCAFLWWRGHQAEEMALRQARFDTETARREADRLRAAADARDRRDEVERRKTAGRVAAADLLGQAEDALRAGDAERAGEALGEAGRRVDEGGADELRPRLARCRADLALLRDLDRIDDDRWASAEGRLPPFGLIADRWAAAFAGYGVTPGSGPPAEAGRRVADSLIRGRLLATLEVWLVSGGRDPNLRAVLAAADPDEFRNEARAAGYQRAVVARAFRGRHPSPQPAWFAAAHGQDRGLDRRAREQLLLSAYRAAPDNFPVLMALAAADEDGTPGAADRRAGWYRAALAARPRNAAAWNNLGNALVGGGDPDGGAAAYREAIRLAPRLGAAHYNLGNVLRDRKDWSGAADCYQASVRLDPRLVEGHYNLGVVLQAAGDSDGAVSAYKNTLRLDTGHARAHLNLGAVYFHQKRYAEARDAAREAVRLGPDVPNAHFLLGGALLELRDRYGAEAAWRKAAQLDEERFGPWLRKLPPVALAPRPRSSPR